MDARMIIAGFGGQGIVFTGQLLAEIGMRQGYNVTVFPSYGPEMRGGTANCTTVISTDAIYSPIVASPNILVAMNQPSLDKFEACTEGKGLVLINSSLAQSETKREDIAYLEVPATETAAHLGDVRIANMVAVGALNSQLSLFPNEMVKSEIERLLGRKGTHLLEMNLRAVDEGIRFGSNGKAS